MLFAFLENRPKGITFVVLVIIPRAVSAIGASILFVAAFATLASVFPDRLSTVNGVVETGLSIGYTLGPGIGGVLFDVGGFKLPLLTVGGLLLLLAFAAIVVIPSVSDNGHEKPVSFVSFLRIPLVVVIMLTFFIIGILEDTICVVIEPFLLDKFEFSHSVIGLLLMIPFFSLSLCAILFGYLSDYMKWGAGIAFFGILCCALSMFLIDPPRLLIPVRFGLVTLIAGLILMGIGVSASMVPIYALCLEEACRHGFEDNAATINLISSTSNSATSFGLFMGPVVGGSLYEAIGMPKLMLLYCGVLVLFSILFLATYLFSRRKSSVDLAEPS
ncbi:hypothetical protein BOX15_Mlig010620g2 [Macrostomum lignano]|uniref:Major facilitator superfamily (MFS) profile domain-containing protein n=1 Tax=Macrostomum lignano TaxID=282301 RepID=A0A267GCL2_9PLAT|nr:hypothetical protein BOX15_Mlig010620g2 [Macrostomum lignano]